MDFVRQTVESSVLSDVFDLPPSMRDTQVEVIILPTYGENEKRNNKINIGFMPGPPLPDSFFDPLPEEELQAWGL